MMRRMRGMRRVESGAPADAGGRVERRERRTPAPPQIMTAGWTGSTSRLASGDTTERRPK